MAIGLTAGAELCVADANRRGALPERKGGASRRSPLRREAPPRHTKILRRPLTPCGWSRSENRTSLSLYPYKGRAAGLVSSTTVNERRNNAEST